MPYYKTPTNQLHWLDSGNDDKYLPIGCVQISDDEAESIQSVAVTLTQVTSITPRQIRQVLTAAGFRAQAEAAVAAGNQDLRDWWEFASSFERSHPVLIAMATSLGLTEVQIDGLFAQAALL